VAGEGGCRVAAMGWKKHSAKEIALKLSQSQTLISNGMSVAEAARQIGVAEPTYFRWRKEYGGLKLDQIERLKQLEAENARLRRIISELDASALSSSTT
jgi:transposase-like protein